MNTPSALDPATRREADLALCYDLRIVERADTSRFPNIAIHQEVRLGEHVLHSFHGSTAHRSACEAYRLAAETIERHGVAAVLPKEAPDRVEQLALL
jgi:hypothetical protein